jgi:hypothetical protein
MAIICGIFLYGTFFRLANSPNPEQKDGFLSFGHLFGQLTFRLFDRMPFEC